MIALRYTRWPCRILVVAVCAAAGGCASLPRIDPTGERICIWPKDQPQVPALTVAPASVTAPPVLTDPMFPAPAAAAIAAAPTAAPTVLPVQAVAAVAEDKLNITPARVLAPVGSEVVLKASICSDEGFTLADQKVEWTLGRNGVGEFVELGGKGLFHPPLLPFLRGKKVDNYFAEGYTANGPLCIDRGTADPSDDVNVNRGDAWISVTAAHEGVSYVSAMAPSVDSWVQRKGTATIYWVDVQWVFPPAEVASSGRPQTLATTVTRQSDGTPVEGYLVRYEVADGGSISGGGSGQVVEVRTGADGRATAEVSPTMAGAASSRINIQLVRPSGYGGGDSPRLIVASGSTVIRWTGDTTPYLPPSTGAVPSYTPPLSTGPPLSSTPPVATYPTQPTTPTTPASPSTSIPGSSTPLQTMPTRRPQLEVEVTGPTQVEVGGEARFNVVVRNTGDAPATRVVVTDAFQVGLSHLQDPRGEQRIEYGGIGTLEPGASRTVQLSFSVNVAGRLCHDVTVTSAEGANPQPQRACIDALPPAVQRQPAVRVEIDGPAYAVVGEQTRFSVSVRNTGNTPLANVVVEDEYPASIFRVRSLDQGVQIVGGRIRRDVGRLERGQSRQFFIDCLPMQTVTQVRALATVTADPDPPGRPIRSSDDHELEVRPALQGGAGAGAGPGGLGAGAPGPAMGQGLSVTAAFLAPQSSRGVASVRAGTRPTLQVTIRNEAARDDGDVELRVVFPTNMTPDLAAVQGPPGVRFELVGDRLQFTPVLTHRPGEDLNYLIDVSIMGGSGPAEILSAAVSRNQQRAVERRTQVDVVGR